MGIAVVKPAVGPNASSSRVNDENKGRMDALSEAPAPLFLAIFEVSAVA